MNKLATKALEFYLQNDLDNFTSHYAKLNEEEKAKLILPMADCLLRKEFFSNAETLFKENLKTRYSPLAHLKYIECLLKQSNVDKGIVECKSLVRYSAFNFNSNYYYTAILHLGSFYRLQNKSEEVKRVVTVCPDDILPDAKNELSIYLLSQGNKEYDNNKLDILRHYSHRLLEEFVNSKSSEEDMLTRSVDLSSSLSCKQQRVRSIELVFRRSNYPLIKRIDPFLGGTRDYVNISQSRLKQLSEAKRLKNEEFIPSFILSSKNKKRFKYLTHIHIAKCAGTTFGHTLAKMADFLHSETTKCRMKSTKYVNYLSHGDLIDKDHIDAIANTILSNQIQDTLEGSFISCYWNNWEIIRDLLSRKYKAESVLFSIIRDPFKRLVSNLKHNAYYNSLDIDQLKEYVYSYPQNFFNTIASSLPKNLNRDDLIVAEMSSTSVINSVKSLHLSCHSMPNLLQKRTYNSENQRQYRNRLPNESMILNFARQLTDELFIKDDTEIYNYLMRAKCKSEFDFGDLVGEEIHPLTILIDDYRFCEVIPTISLFDKI